MTQITDRDTPFTPEDLAKRWRCTPAHIRNMCRTGEIENFRVGKFYRITVETVRRIEQCQTSASEDTKGASASTGGKTESGDALVLKHAPERKQSQKPSTSTVERLTGQNL